MGQFYPFVLLVVLVGSRVRSNDLCRPAVNELVQHGVASLELVDQLPSNGDGPFPGVIDMFGTAGGLLEYRSAQLATRGIISLALAYCDYEDLPKDLTHLDLKYFEDAVHILLKQEKVLKPCVGAVGVSKGGDLALTMATFIPQVSLAVCINGGCSALVAAIKISDDYSIPSLGFDETKIKIRTFKGAGHLIEPPYSPFCFASYHKIADVNLAWGGDLKAHTEAQEVAWNYLLNFIRKHLQKRE